MAARLTWIRPRPSMIRTGRSEFEGFEDGTVGVERLPQREIGICVQEVGIHRVQGPVGVVRPRNEGDGVARPRRASGAATRPARSASPNITGMIE